MFSNTKLDKKTAYKLADSNNTPGNEMLYFVNQKYMQGINCQFIKSVRLQRLTETKYRVEITPLYAPDRFRVVSDPSLCQISQIVDEVDNEDIDLVTQIIDDKAALEAILKKIDAECCIDTKPKFLMASFLNIKPTLNYKDVIYFVRKNDFDKAFEIALELKSDFSTLADYVAQFEPKQNGFIVKCFLQCYKDVILGRLQKILENLIKIPNPTADEYPLLEKISLEDALKFAQVGFQKDGAYLLGQCLESLYPNDLNFAISCYLEINSDNPYYEQANERLFDLANRNDIEFSGQAFGTDMTPSELRLIFAMRSGNVNQRVANQLLRELSGYKDMSPVMEAQEDAKTIIFLIRKMKELVEENIQLKSKNAGVKRVGFW